MTDKQEIIEKIKNLQKEFIKYEHEHGISPSEYFNPPAGHPLENYREEHAELARQMVDIAHTEKGSRR